MTAPFRPELHVTTTTGMINAPAGAIHDGHDWHVFSQYRDDADSPARWAHHVRCPEQSNMWRQLADVVVPCDGETDVWAGSAIKDIDGGGATLFFTSVRNGSYTINTAHIGDLEATKTEQPGSVSPQVRRGNVVVDDREGLTNFRSPCVVPDWRTSSGATGPTWLMLAVTGAEQDPTIAVLHSANQVDWSVEGVLNMVGESGIEDSYRIVSPRLLYLTDEVDGNTKDVLLLTLERDGDVDRSGYLVGRLNGASFHVDTPFTPVDYGHDFTRPRATAISPNGWSSDSDQVLIFGLMSPISRGFDPRSDPSFESEGWDRCLSLGKLTTLQDGRLYFTPSQLLVEATMHAQRTRAITAVLDVPAGGFAEIAILDSNDDVVATVTHCGDTLVLDRSLCPAYADEDPAVTPLIDTDTQACTVIVDSSCIDVFADGGVVSMTSRLWPQHPVAGFRLSTGNGASVQRSMLFGGGTDTDVA